VEVLEPLVDFLEMDHRLHTVFHARVPISNTTPQAYDMEPADRSMLVTLLHHECQKQVVPMTRGGGRNAV
jgi:hypothetical protein